MSTLKTTYIQHPSAAEPSIELSADGTVVLPLSGIGDLADVDEGSGFEDGNVLIYDALSGFWIPGEPAAGAKGGYLYAGTVYYTTSGTFEKADPFGTGDIGLKAIRVRICGGGGGSGGVPATGGSVNSLSGSGGGGGGAERFITDIASLSASETVTVGAGGTGGAAGGTTGGVGGTSTAFGITANGGGGGQAGFTFTAGGDAQRAAGGQGSVSGTYDVVLYGSGGDSSHTRSGGPGEPGSAFLGSNMTAGGKLAATIPGQGGRGVSNPNDRGATAGANGAPGIVIVDCFV